MQSKSNIFNFLSEYSRQQRPLFPDCQPRSIPINFILKKITHKLFKISQHLFTKSRTQRTEVSENNFQKYNPLITGFNMKE